jgi:predicted enzyme related to lactoylglutathione lyase
MGKPVVHWEFWTENLAKVSDFYAKVFDWKIQDMPGMNYRMVDTQGPGINGGIMTPQRSGPWPGNMSFYIDVEDLKSYRKRIVDAGGKILVEEQQVPGMGAFSLFSDPDGRVLGIWKQDPRGN